MHPSDRTDANSANNSSTTTTTTGTAEHAKPASLIELIRFRQAEIGITDQQLADALGYDRVIIVTLFKQGTMRLPLAKIPALADALAVDPTDLMRMALAESLPELLPAIEKVYNPLRLTQAEISLIQRLRKLTDGGEVQTVVLDAGSRVVALVAPGPRTAPSRAPGVIECATRHDSAP